MFRARRAYYERRNTDLLVCAASGVPLRFLAKRKADRMSAWRTGQWPVFLILPMPTGAADAADDANSYGQRDNPGRKKRQRNTNHTHTPHQRACPLLNGAAHGSRQTRPLRYQITLG